MEAKIDKLCSLLLPMSGETRTSEAKREDEESKN
jgi:hypothetical protein